TKPTACRRVPKTRAGVAKIVVNGVKTIMVNEPLRAQAARRFALAPVLRTGHGHIEIESRIIHDGG
ncbi:MAG TPA: hypothetical protein VN838_30025, partial [Bradyrhizobium sp.]|nr:hypothetical protein [Bradyrhizobium sp.]